MTFWSFPNADIIWPIVVISAWDLIRALLGGADRASVLRIVVAASAMVFMDAYLIEPIAVGEEAEPGECRAQSDGEQLAKR